jgi:hypothetical protein
MELICFANTQVVECGSESDVGGKYRLRRRRPSKVSSGWHCYAGPPFPPSSVVESYWTGLGKWNSLRAARPSQHGAKRFEISAGTVGRFLPTLDYQNILGQRGIFNFENAARYFYNIFRVCKLSVCM